MKLQKCTISIHPVVASLNPTLLAKLMTLDKYCYPVRTYKPHLKEGGYMHYEQGTKCELYFKKTFSKAALHRANQAVYPTGLFVRLCNTWDNPCIIQDGHDSDYAVWLYEWEDIHRILLEVAEETTKVLNRGNGIEHLISQI